MALIVCAAIALIFAGGFFALAESAIVNARSSALRSFVDDGRRGARAAQNLLENPGRFLPSVRAYGTLLNVSAAVLGGIAIAAFPATQRDAGFPTVLVEPLGFVLIVALVTYLCGVVGRRVPDRLALRDPQAAACRVAPLVTLLSRVAEPAIRLLDWSAKIVTPSARVEEEEKTSVTDEDVHSVVAEAAGAGVIDSAERHMITGVLKLGDRTVRAVMTPSGQVDRIDLSAGERHARETLTSTQHSRLPVSDGSPDAIIGVVQTRELLHQMLMGRRLDVRASVRRAPAIPDSGEALHALAVLRSAEVPMAIVHDEYGNFKGIVTPANLLQTIAGVFGGDAESAEPDAVRAGDGSWQLAGRLPVQELAEHLGLPLSEKREYTTAAGFVLAALQRLPALGDTVVVGDWRFEVRELEGHRIEKLVAYPHENDGVETAGSLNFAASAEPTKST